MANRPPGRCAFCDKGGVTKEHLFSDWMRGIFPRKLGYNMHRKTAIERSDGEIRFTPTAKIRQGDILTIRVRAVCRKCNNEWMSNLVEEGAKPNLERLIRADQFELDDKGQKAVATWAAVKCVVCEYRDRPTAGVTSKDKHFIWIRKRPPSHWQIWIGHYEGTEWFPARYRHHGWGLLRQEGALVGVLPPFAVPDQPNDTQATTFVIGRVLIHIISCDVSAVAKRFRDPLARKLHQIWPPQRDRAFYIFPRKIVWPPVSQPLTDEDVMSVADAFFNSTVSASEARLNK
jgi:hypothetical protein